MTNKLNAIFLLLLILLSACATIKQIGVPQITPKNSDKTFTHSGIATAGAVSIDITPPPGLPMGGYSIMANKGLGFRTRLKARIIYLNDGAGNATALVQTDLTASSLLLHHMVASEVAEKTGLRPGDIAITASHSHSAPANFFENDFYNKHMSSGKGLDEEFLAFTVQQISTGIVKAYQQQRPAKVATGKKDIYGFNRNRSLAAYKRNTNINPDDFLDEDAIFKAVNPTLYMIRIDVKSDNGKFLPLAAFSSFSVHATAITPQVEVYNADLFAYAQKDLEWQIKNDYQAPWPVVHALTTGTQGDMAPALKQQGDNYAGHFPLDWKAAKKIGQGIGKEAITLFEELKSHLSHNVSIKTAANEINIRKNNIIEDIELCKDAAVGSPVVGGAYERRTPWLTMIPFFKAGNALSHRWLFTDGCQGNKSHAAFSFIQPMLEPKDSFPQIVMFQLIHINDIVILPLPFEVTTEAGRRISANVKKTLQTKPKHVWITSNSNGYFGYTTTLEEYGQQNYEGGHTLYGKNTTPYLSAQLVTLAKKTVKQHKMLPSWQYEVAINQFMPEQSTNKGNRSVFQQPELIKKQRNLGESYVSFKWLDVGPRDINYHQPLVHVEKKLNQQWKTVITNNEPVSDEGYDIEVRFIDRVENGMALYETRWYNPLSDEYYRFVIEPRKNQNRLLSAQFSVK